MNIFNSFYNCIFVQFIFIPIFKFLTLGEYGLRVLHTQLTIFFLHDWRKKGKISGLFILSPGFHIVRAVEM